MPLRYKAHSRSNYNELVLKLILDIEHLVEMPTKHRELKGNLLVEIPIEELSHEHDQWNLYVERFYTY